MKTSRYPAADAYLPLLRDLTVYLERPDLILVAPATTQSLAARARDLTERLKAADDRICIGLVGGTGVGKSTLINALAGREISARTDVRPTTDRLILYRHRDNRFSLSDDETVVLHEAVPLLRVCLADFPDFDSLEPQHRQTLARHFVDLDLLIWVVDPVKYADQVLFHWLEHAPQAQVNSIFVFNKIDALERRYGKRTQAVVAEVTADFSRKLTDYGGFREPRILPLSALKALERPEEESPEFAALLSYINELREKKRRLSIKNLNLAAMSTSLITDLTASAAPESIRYRLERLDQILSRGRRDMADLLLAEAERTSTVMRGSWRSGLTADARDRSPWPLNFFLFVWDGLTGLLPGRKQARDHERQLPQPELVALSRRLETWRSELLAVFGPGETAPGDYFKTYLAQMPSAAQVTEAGSQALMAAGLEKAKEVSRRYRWRIRHHWLPVLVLLYPLLPLILSWGLPRLFGQTDPTGLTIPQVQLVMGWRDVWPLLGTVGGLYLLETIYFAFSLDRRAMRILDRMVKEWRVRMIDLIEKELMGPVEAFTTRLAEEIEMVNHLSHRVIEFEKADPTVAMKHLQEAGEGRSPAGTDAGTARMSRT